MYKYFQENEIKGLAPILVEMLDIAREIAGVPFRITSGCRSEAHNQEVGGVQNSSHLTGLAVDIACDTSRERYLITNALLRVGFKRLGLYKTHIHADIDPDKAKEILYI